MQMIDSDEVKRKAVDLGFDLVGITTADPFQKFEKIVTEGIRSGRLPKNMVRDEPVIAGHDRTHDPTTAMPGARSIIVLGIRYLLEESHEQGLPWDPRGRISRMHWRDFQRDLLEKRKAMIDHLRSNGYEALDEVSVPVKPSAYRSGVGVYGKNTIIQNEDHGSWIILTSILTNAELSPDEQLEPRCGACQRCIRLCPTKAIAEPYMLDASRCLNYVLASESPIPEEMRELVGDRINGCDACLEVCPRNDNVAAIKSALPPRFGDWGRSPKLLDILRMGPEEFDMHFSDLDWYDPSLRTLKRNAMVALGNTGDCTTLHALEPFAIGPDEDLAEHARWAMDRIRKRDAEGK